MPDEFDVALSFAGEQRDYVRRVAQILEGKGVRVFYDEFYTSHLWGKDLVPYLREVYFKKSRFCIMFISKDYVTKAWPSHERRSALEKQMTLQKGEYIIPVRFDETDVPGLTSTIGYLDAKKFKPEDVATLFLEKYLSSEE